MNPWALLLAAGASTRMGQPKALLPWQGKTLLRFQIDQLLEVEVAGVLVVLGSDSEKLLPLVVGIPRVRAVVNADYKTGQCSSIKTGVEQLPPEADCLLILAVDQPRPSPLFALLLREHEGAGAVITVPKYRGRRGHPPVFSHSLFPELMNLSEERQGLREVLARHRARVKEVEVACPEALLDLNTLQDYERALASWAPMQNLESLQEKQQRR